MLKQRHSNPAGLITETHKGELSLKKMKIFNIITVVFCLLILITGCRKDLDELTTGEETVLTESTTVFIEGDENPTILSGNINDFFTVSQNSIQTSSIDSETTNLVYGQNGTLLNIPSGIFQFMNGTPVSGMVDLELIEIFFKDDMVRSNKPTTAGGALLVSGGELYIMAYQNGEKLEIIPGESMTIRVPTVTNYGTPWEMTKFYGTEMEDGTVDWELAENAQVQLTESMDTIGLAFEFPETRLGWINCDYFYDQSNLTSVTIFVPEENTSTNTAVFLIFEDIHSVCRISNYDADNNYFISNGNYSLPEGLDVTAFAVSKAGDVYTAAFVPFQITTDIVVPITLEEMSLENIHAQLQSY